MTTQGLGQTADQGFHLVGEHPGDQSLERLGAQRRQSRLGDLHRHPVLRIAGLEAIAQLQRHALDRHLIGIGATVRPGRIGAHQILAVHEQPPGILTLGGLPPALETHHVVNIRRDALRVEVEGRFFIQQGTGLAKLGFLLEQLGPQRTIVRQKAPAGTAFPGHQALADQKLPR